MNEVDLIFVLTALSGAGSMLFVTYSLAKAAHFLGLLWQEAKRANSLRETKLMLIRQQQTGARGDGGLNSI